LKNNPMHKKIVRYNIIICKEANTGGITLNSVSITVQDIS
jgi:hypothetical protein